MNDATYVSIIYQLLDTKCDKSKLGPGVKEFLRGLELEMEVIRWDDPSTADYIMHYADVVLNDNEEIRKGMH
jgi:hypothetical protein